MGHLNSTSDAPLLSTALSPVVLSATVVPPVVPPLYPKYGVIHRNSFKPLGRPCIPFHSIPQTANAGVCRLPGEWKGMLHSSCVLNVPMFMLPYSLLFLILSPQSLTLPYPPPSTSLDSMWRIDRGSKSDRL
ncbi:hypothetical protein XELAEV_18034901mg [Xenopus laevis]|uniref:Uncharacterized protein n=1 Tax=Xenopus laevis TaxID=8355 RepID=A0A974CER9_XENLA|nr:hypothetical protein XELAEV_18034901mg [Xenopus laevis]